MSYKSPFFVGYRRALRDVQQAIIRHARNVQDNNHKRDLYFTVADTFTLDLRDLNRQNSPLKEHVDKLEAQLNPTDELSSTEQRQSHSKTSKNFSKTDLFEEGYKSGFSYAIRSIAEYKTTMNDPRAHTAIASLIEKLDTVQANLADNEHAKLKTLRARKYLL